MKPTYPEMARYLRSSTKLIAVKAPTIADVEINCRKRARSMVFEDALRGLSASRLQDLEDCKDQVIHRDFWEVPLRESEKPRVAKVQRQMEDFLRHFNVNSDSLFEAVLSDGVPAQEMTPEYA